MRLRGSVIRPLTSSACAQAGQCYDSSRRLESTEAASREVRDSRAQHRPRPSPGAHAGTLRASASNKCKGVTAAQCTIAGRQTGKGKRQAPHVQSFRDTALHAAPIHPLTGVASSMPHSATASSVPYAPLIRDKEVDRGLAGGTWPPHTCDQVGVSSARNALPNLRSARHQQRIGLQLVVPQCCTPWPRTRTHLWAGTRGPPLCSSSLQLRLFAASL